MRVQVLLVSAAIAWFVGCGESETFIGGGGGSGGAGGSSSSGGSGGSGTGGGTGVSGTCADGDGDGYTTCAGDCNDSNKDVNPGTAETQNGIDDNCDAKIDNKISGYDSDKDGTPYPQDCDDDNAVIGPNAVEVPGNTVDENCSGAVDDVANCNEAAVSPTSNTARDLATAIGLCGPFALDAGTTGNTASRRVRERFGNKWLPRQGPRLAMLSTGKALDGNDSYSPQSGTGFSFSSVAHPLYSPPKMGCGTAQANPSAYDVAKLTLTLKVPQNAQGFSFDFAFFSSEYPEYVCTQYNDRFIALLSSQALVPSTVAVGQCKSASSPATCNVSYDSQSQPVTINNALFQVCDTFVGKNKFGLNISNTCALDAGTLEKTGYDTKIGALRIGGATDWLTTKAPVKPGETATLELIVLDEGDDSYDSAVIVDNFKWITTEVKAPDTTPAFE